MKMIMRPILLFLLLTVVACKPSFKVFDEKQALDRATRILSQVALGENFSEIYKDAWGLCERKLLNRSGSEI